MSEQESKTNGQSWFQQLLFLRLFQGFRLAVQPGKLAVALLGVILLFLGGCILDWLTPHSAMVLNDVQTGMGMMEEPGFKPGAYSELEAYVLEAPLWMAPDAPTPRKNPQAYHKFLQKNNEEFLSGQLNSDTDFTKVAEPEKIREGDALKKIKESYKDSIKEALESLQECYELRQKAIEDLEDEDAQKLETDELKRIRKGMTQALLGKASESLLLYNWSDTLIKDLKDEKLKTASKAVDEIDRARNLADLYRMAQLERGEGVFQTLVNFKIGRLHKAMRALVTLDFKTAKSQVYQIVMMMCWMTRMHPIIIGILMLYCLAIYAVIGGALCRMAAVQFARDERIGAWRALQFSLGKFGSYFTAPLIPLGIIIFVAIFIFVGGLCGAIPYVGEILAPILMGLALFGGFIIALVSVGLMAGFNLMYPTIAVEGSDSFDAISRAFSYVFARPWRMGFYSFLAAVYGGICYVFVRVFAWLLLISVYAAAGMGMNVDDSSVTGSMDLRGKLEAIWPTPTLGDLQPSVNWITLNWSECIGAAVIWIWVALVAGLVLAFVFSFFYSVNTVIYCLLRKQVDDTDLEDIYIEQDVEELVGEEVTEEGAPSEGGEEAPAEGEGETSTGEETGESEKSSGEDEGLEKTE
jgi:hypothetical protein